MYIFDLNEKNKEKNDLNMLAIHGLESMFNSQNKRFCFRMLKTKQGLRPVGSSYRYTIISVLGLHQCETLLEPSPFDVKDLTHDLINAGDKIDNIGDLGLLLWLSSLVDPDKAIGLFSAIYSGKEFERYEKNLQGHTTELSWFLTGLSLIGLITDWKVSGLHELAVHSYKQLVENYGNNGIFRHVNGESFSSKLRARIGCFADQVYPIYALSVFARATDDNLALKIALQCANTICKLQGPLGQWWWHYDSDSGKVIGRYPVFAVHQDAMAPMALLAIGEIASVDFSSYINKGMKWIFGTNELYQDLIDSKLNIIWRSLSRKKLKLLIELGIYLFKKKSSPKTPSDLNINFECRPYHLGWILYASHHKNISDLLH